MWQVILTKQATKDSKLLGPAKLKSKAEKLLHILAENPFQTPPSYEKLNGELSSAYSRRINLQHRLVYEILEKERTVKILRMWSHYE